jgi:hypothetical protein
MIHHVPRRVPALSLVHGKRVYDPVIINMYMSSGEERAWELLGELDPADVSRSASVVYKNGAYMLRSLGMDFSVYPRNREIKGISPGADAVAGRLGYFFNHSVLWYLVGAKDIGLTGRLIRPSDAKGGHHFFKGTHELPLDRVAGKYASDRDGFIKRARALDGRPLDFGDASFELLPLPRIPVTLILWLGDEEFPPRLDLFLDSTCEIHLPLDIIWSTAMYSTIMML